jgi:hypothetical protein
VRSGRGDDFGGVPVVNVRDDAGTDRTGLGGALDDDARHLVAEAVGKWAVAFGHNADVGVAHADVGDRDPDVTIRQRFGFGLDHLGLEFAADLQVAHDVPFRALTQGR